MSGAREINQDAFSHHSAAGFALNAAICGAVDDCVLRFLAGNFRNEGPEGYCVAADDINEGTVVTLQRAGKWYASMALALTAAAADADVIVGISLDAAAAVRQVDATYNALFANGFLPPSVGETVIPVASCANALVMARAECTFRLTSAQAAGGGAELRFHASTANGTPAANILNGGAAGLQHSFHVLYLGEYIG